ncbi:MAG TPA: hypothetical protein VNZ86_07040, partial [Bacteroidia bacterium]|nr:hypothetical protein [Bacteroidia bacterium]
MVRYKTSAFTSQGMPAMNMLFWFNDSTMLRIRSFLKGPCNIKLLAVVNTSSYNSPEVNTFFDSFQASPFVHLPLNEQNVSGTGIKLKLPGTLKAYKNDSTFTLSDPGLKMYSAYDERTGITYYMSREQMSRYYWVKNDSTFYAEHLESVRKQNDTILSQHVIHSGGISGREVIYSNNASHCRRRMNMYLKGDIIYSVYSYLPATDMRDAYNDSIFQSISFTEPEPHRNVFIKQTELLLKDLASTDSTDRNRARRYVYGFHFEKKDLPQLYKALLLSYPDDTLNYASTRQRFLVHLQTVYNDSTVPFLRAFIADTRVPEHLRISAITTLCHIHTPDSYTLIKQLLETDKALYSKNNSANFLLNDSLAARILYPGILSLVTDSVYNYGLMTLTHRLLDSGLIRFADIMPYTAAINHAALQMMKRAAAEQKLSGAFTADNEALYVLGYSSADAGDELAASMLGSKDPSAMLAAVEYALNKNKPVRNKDLNFIAGTISTRFELYRMLQRKKQTTLFPAHYAKREFLAEADLFLAQSDDDPFQGKLVY